jgi:hypothetical protein
MWWASLLVGHPLTTSHRSTLLWGDVCGRQQGYSLLHHFCLLVLLLLLWLLLL